ncbi:phosphatase PAP2 family protein [Streptomyces sp. NPDC001493]
MPPPSAHRLPLRGPRRTAATAAVVCAVLLAALVVAVAVHPAPFAADTAVHDWALEHRPVWVRRTAHAVTVTGSGVPAYALAALAGALAHRTSVWRGAAAGLLALGSAQLPRIALATAVARPRPPAGDWAASASGWSLPSGHTTTSLVVGVLLAFAVHRRVHGRGRSVLLAAPPVWAFAVGLSRVWLGVHWPTDVVAGWLFAACWTASAALLVLLRRQRAAARAVPLPSDERWLT